MLIVAQLCEYSKNHKIVYYKWVNYKVCELYLNKSVKNNLGHGSGYFSVKSHRVNILGFVRHITSLSHIVLYFHLQSFTNVKTILNSEGIEKQTVGLIWPVSSSLSAPIVGKRCGFLINYNSIFFKASLTSS